MATSPRSRRRIDTKGRLTPQQEHTKRIAIIVAIVVIALVVIFLYDWSALTPK